MPRPYALQVTSQPTKVSEEIWTQWYTEEHIRDLVYSGASKTSAVYRASGESISSGPNTNDDGASTAADKDGTSMNFLALYQSTTKSVFAACASPDSKCKVRTHSSLFGQGQGEPQSAYDVGTFQPVDLQLVEILGSYEHREDVAPWVLHHVISGAAIENKIQFDHVNAVAGLEGYRRTLLYRPIGDVGGDESYVVLVHEFDEGIEEGSLPGVKRDLEVIGPTEGCPFRLRAYRLIESEGFGGKCRTPERMVR